MNRTMRYGMAVTVLLAVANLATAEEAPLFKPQVPPGWSFSLPDGNAKSGQTVFMKMECYSCHRITIPGETIPAKPAGIGPDLTSGYGRLPKEYLAEAIIKAHTVVAAPGYVMKDGLAGMGNYNHFLTVQELIDLVAFLKRP
jgi:sulfur-oxidizing protein SoxX